MKMLDKPAAGRSCGSCTLCCKVLGIVELEKPMGKWCPNCEIGKSCRIYDTRPPSCRTFYCVWLADDRIGDHWKPDRSKIVITPGFNGNGLEFRCDPGHPGAWRKEPYHSEIMQLAMNARALDGAMVVVVNDSTTLVAPEGEFPLGKVDPDQRVVQQFQGTRLVGAKLVHKDELKDRQ